MNNRFHQRPPSLFDNYTGDQRSRTNSASPAPRSIGGYGYAAPASVGVNGTIDGGYADYRGSPAGSFRSATPNKKGQYSDAVLDSLEGQNDEQVSGLIGKVKMLKGLSVAIGDEIRDSTNLAEKMNDSFDGARVRLRGTMNRMLRMAERTGVPWKWWLVFFAALMLLFWYVWLF